jgi:hypothetical protein
MATSSSTRRMLGGIEETSASFEARSAPRSYPTKTVLGRGGELRASELQLCRTIVSAHSAIMRLPAISIFESWPIRNVTTSAMIGPAASTTRPSVISRVASLIQPMTYGPTKRPRLPIEFINAMPPAAAEPPPPKAAGSDWCNRRQAQGDCSRCLWTAAPGTRMCAPSGQLGESGFDIELGRSSEQLRKWWFFVSAKTARFPAVLCPLAEGDRSFPSTQDLSHTRKCGGASRRTWPPD